MGGNPCSVSKQCHLAQDPCSKKAPWECMATNSCYFKPATPGSNDGTCSTLPQFDYCKPLGMSQCAMTAGCKWVDRCACSACKMGSDVRVWAAVVGAPLLANCCDALESPARVQTAHRTGSFWVRFRPCTVHCSLQWSSLITGMLLLAAGVMCSRWLPTVTHSFPGVKS